MTGTRRQDIIDILLGRGHTAPEAYARQRWPSWMRLRPRPSSARRDALLALYRERPSPRRVPALPAPGPLGHWIGLILWQMQPPPADQRGLRVLALACSAGLHLLFAVLLLWVALVRSLPPAPVQEDRVAVRFESAGSGDGGSEPARSNEQEADQASVQPVQEAAPAVPGRATDAATPVSASSVQVAEATQMAEAMQLEMPVLPLLHKPLDVPQPSPLPVTERELGMVQAAPQPLPLPLVVAAARPVDRVLSVPEQTLVLAAEAPLVRLPDPAQIGPAVTLPLPTVAVVERAVVSVQPLPQLRAVAVPAVAAVSVAEVAVPVREREVVMRPRAPALRGVRPAPASVALDMAGVDVPAVDEREVVVARSAGASMAADAQGAARPAAAVPPGVAAAASPVVAGRGSAAVAAAGPGGAADWSRPGSADDWSAAAGAGRGNDRFDASGSRSLPDAPAAVRGAPGGTADQWTRQQIDSGGTWLKRPPYDHRPTSFDKYWVPNESLLAEWVRKGMQSVDIPIPGSSSRISCVISLLQLGGGCGLTDPDRQEQPAQARAAPDIPFKPELQQDNGSL